MLNKCAPSEEMQSSYIPVAPICLRAEGCHHHQITSVLAVSPRSRPPTSALKASTAITRMPPVFMSSENRSDLYCRALHRARVPSRKCFPTDAQKLVNK